VTKEEYPTDQLDSEWRRLAEVDPFVQNLTVGYYDAIKKADSLLVSLRAYAKGKLERRTD
jgi:hypothetical protein